MKTKEFIKKINELGYNVKETEHSMIVRKEYTHLAVIDKENIYGFKYFYHNDKDLFKLCVDYTSTPIEEREEEKKFYLKKIESFYDADYKEELAFLNVFNDKYFVLNNSKQENCYKTQFTQKEIDKIKEEQHTDLSEFKQIPIEEIEAE